ncbi:MAG: BrnA antitoxin family protein [Planctomycetes bacterium]|nr:BrnA antitoxin family protein [Planctomycetota bacterium]
MPNCTPSLIASQLQNPRRRTATPVVSLNRARPNIGHTWTPNCPTYFLPIPKYLKQPVTMRFDKDTVGCFKSLSEKTGIPYQTLINLYLRDCAMNQRKLHMKWAT